MVESLDKYLWCWGNELRVEDGNEESAYWSIVKFYQDNAAYRYYTFLYYELNAVARYTRGVDNEDETYSYWITK